MLPLKDHFIPWKRNNYKPHALQKAAVIGMMILVFLSFSLTNLQALLWVSSDWLVSTILPAVIVTETNEERMTEALPQLRRNSVLDQAAQLKAEHMARHSYFAHYSPDGVSPWYWFGQAGYSFIHAGENLAIHFNDSGEVVKAWMNSPTHRANIMNGNFREIGIGVAEGKYDGFQTVYVVQLFGAPAVVAAASAPVAQPTAPTVAAAEPEQQPAPEVGRTVEPEPETESETVQVAGIEEGNESTTTVLETPETIAAAEPPDELPLEMAPEFESVEVSDTGVVAYSGLIATSAPGIPATVEPVAQSTDPFLGFVTKPQLVLQFLYATIGLFVIIALALSIIIEIRRQHPVQVAYGAGLLATMWLLFYVHISLTSGAVVL